MNNKVSHLYFSLKTQLTVLYHIHTRYLNSVIIATEITSNIICMFIRGIHDTGIKII